MEDRCDTTQTEISEDTNADKPDPDPSAHLFPAFHMLEKIHGYDNETAKTRRQQAIDNIAACTTVSAEEKRKLSELYYNTKPPKARQRMSETNAEQMDEKLAEAKNVFDEYMRNNPQCGELSVDIVWLVEMNFFIGFALAEKATSVMKK